ncbi:hypothetical protein [Citrobacter sp. CRE-46]|uniref:hypothetical protein n=1 Tax=Citrobacter sp. CRE-46 TaxID=1703250 RepID=UPI000D7C5945|nr:hypothetical protein [Citrobacter sp. CRE-46]AWS97530.1 hypothetical protein AN232_21120 [Citrobacter sp. CRE-46]AWS97581.1 hypothetical protein AN232_21415 [Citrobacter sp. CRE-46]
MSNNNLTDERLSALIRVARDSLELYEMELPVIDDVMLALAELQQRRAAMLQAGNSPVIGIDLASEPDRSVEVRYLAPPGYVMLPKVVTPEIGNAINEVGQRCTCGNCSQRLWDLLLAAAPQQEVK